MQELPKSLREQIPWYPAIDSNLCNNCGVCLEYCKNDVYSIKDISIIVTNPFNCVMLCDGCKCKCEIGAISFPNKDAVRPLVEKANLILKECNCGDGCSDDCDCKI